MRKLGYILKRMDGEIGRRAIQSPILEMAECTLAGVRDIILVVGNDEDVCEVALVPLAANVDMHTPREKGALLEAAKLQA